MRPPAGSSDCWSLGSNHYPADKFPKVSIGITVEKCPKLGSGTKNKDRIVMPACGSRPSFQENAVIGSKGPGFVENSKKNGKLIDKDQKASEILSTRLIPHETPTMQTIHVCAKHNSVLDTEEGIPKNVTVVASKGYEAGKAEKSSACFSGKSLHEIPIAQKVQFSANQASVPESQDGDHKKAASIVCGKTLEKGENSQRTEVAFTAMQEMHVPSKGVDCEQSDKVTKHKNEGLKMKLWEILGMASESKRIMNPPNPEDKEVCNGSQFGLASQSNQIMNSQTPRDKKTLNRNLGGEQLKENSINAKQNSDAIQTDSESPNEIVRRPVTRSMTQMKVSTRASQKLRKDPRNRKKPLSSSSSEFKMKLEEKNIFTFDDEEAQEVNSGRYVNDHPRSRGKGSNQKKKRMELPRIQIPKQLVADKNSKSNERGKTVSSPDKLSPRSQEIASSPCLPLQHDKDKLQTSNKVTNVKHHLQSEENEHLVTPPVARSAATQGHCGSLKRKRYSWEHVKSQVPNDVHLEKGPEHSSVEKISIPMDASPPSPRCQLLNEDLWTPVATQRRNPSRTSSGSKMENHKQKTDSLSSDTESADETREIHESENMMFPHDPEGKEAERQSLSPRKDQDWKNIRGSDFFDKGYVPSEEWFLNSGSLHKSPGGFHQMKRAHSIKDKKIGKRSLSSPSPFATSRTEEATGAHEVFEQYPEDSLARAVCQLALLLERFKTKMKSQICKTSSEIVTAAGEKVCLQLQDAEYQIEADLGNFLSIGKSKGKCLESKFQEQQERLRFMHDKFKEEVEQHFLGCRNTLEEIEAHKIELKGSLDRQKASHRKLLLQVQESIESQISDAETRVAALHKETNRKMKVLKEVLKEWMLEGTIN